MPSWSVGQQRRIADFLDDQVARIDNLIAARRQQLRLLEAWTTAQLTEIIFDRETRSVPVSALADVRLGRQRSPENASGAFMTRYLRSANVFDGRVQLTDVLEMNFQPAERAAFELRAGDVLVTEGAGSPEAVGASAIWDGCERGICFQNTLVRLRPRTDEVANEYLGWWARTSHRSGAMRTWATGANILHLGSEGLKRMPILPRNVHAQRDVVKACDRVERRSESMREGLTAALDLLEEFKRSLITAAVSGEFDVSSSDGSRVSA